MSTLAGHETVDVLLKILKIEISEPSSMEEMIVLVHSILARIAPKGTVKALHLGNTPQCSSNQPNRKRWARGTGSCN